MRPLILILALATSALEASGIANKDKWISEKDVKKVEEYALTDMLDATRHPHIRFTSSLITASANLSFVGKAEVRLKSLRPTLGRRPQQSKKSLLGLSNC
ncbi:MAG: hypothetical protein HY235_07380 [Acidobacteria bacterium]|nr:hypothetical protein [Acidobacteriota bacterium]